MTTKEEAQRELLRRKARAELERRKAAAPAEPSFAGGLLKAGGEGLRRGAESTIGMFGDIANINASGADWLAQKLGASPETAATIGGATKFLMPGAGMAPTTEQIGDVTDLALPEHHEAGNRAEKFMQTAGEFLPAALAGPGRLGTRVATQALIPSVASEAAGQATEGSKYEPYARIAAALLAPVGLSAVRRAVTPFPTSPERQRLAETLIGEGVETTAGQQTGSRKLRFMESELGGGAAADVMERQGEQFTRAALNRAGIDAPRATPEVMDQAFTRIGDEFDTLAAQTRVPMDTQLQDDMLNAVVDYQGMTGESARAPLIEGIMNDAAALARQSGALEGEAYKRLRTRITDAVRKGDSNTRGALRDLQESLDDAVERHMPQESVDRWREARRQYRNMLVLEQAATGAGENAAMGLISPSALRNATIQKQGRRNYARGRGDFEELARAGEGVMKPLPDSGTSGRLNARGIGSTLASMLGGGAGAMHSPEAAMAGILLGGAAPAGLGRLMMTGPAQSYLGNQVLPRGNGPGLPALIAALIGARQTPAVAP